MLKGPDFKLGLFAANCSSGSAVTNAPDRWSGSWADNVAAAKIADEVGLDFLLPVARWIGYGGASNYHNDVLDPTTWMAGLLAVTKKILSKGPRVVGCNKQDLVDARTLRSCRQVF